MQVVDCDTFYLANSSLRGMTHANMTSNLPLCPVVWTKYCDVMPTGQSAMESHPLFLMLFSTACQDTRGVQEVAINVWCWLI